MLSSTRQRFRVLGVMLFILALYIVLAYAFYSGLTRHMLGAGDFFPRWMGARALFLRGENPYSDAVTQEIQRAMYGRLARPDEDQVAFAYPLYAAFIIAPFVGLAYAQAQACALKSCWSFLDKKGRTCSKIGHIQLHTCEVLPCPSITQKSSKR